MIVLRSSSYSKKEPTSLKDISYGTHGLSAKSLFPPSLGELTGRRRGMEVADRMDALGKDDIEILDKSSKEAKRMGRVVGGTVGLGTGILAAHTTNKLINKTLKNKDNFKGILEYIRLIANDPNGENSRANKVLKKVVKRGDKFYENPQKYSKRIRKGGKIAGIVLAGLGTAEGIRRGGNRAYKATKRGNLERLTEKYNRNKKESID